jgi:small-conductance mechanosensitive channel
MIYFWTFLFVTISSTLGNLLSIVVEIPIMVFGIIFKANPQKVIEHRNGQTRLIIYKTIDILVTCYCWVIGTATGVLIIEHYMSNWIWKIVFILVLMLSSWRVIKLYTRSWGKRLSHKSQEEREFMNGYVRDKTIFWTSAMAWPSIIFLFWPNLMKPYFSWLFMWIEGVLP